MGFPVLRRTVAALGVLGGIFAAATAFAAPTAEQALRLAPIQKADVDFDKPSPAEAAKCTIKAEKINGQTGWVVRDGDGQLLRQFVDTNADNVVDRWSYYKDGVEVYRDIDENFNGKADQYRWLNLAGTRWGIDKDEDGKIDGWRTISAEEVTAEVVYAIRGQDSGRFARLLLSADDVKALGLGPARAGEVLEKIKAAPQAFLELARQQKAVTAKTTWVNFGGSYPGLVPAGTEGSTNDLVAYENVVAMVETEGQASQVQVGTLVRVGDNWRLIEAPVFSQGPDTRVASSGFFFTTASRGSEQAETSAGGPSEAVRKLLADLESIDANLAKSASTDEQAKLNARRADLLEQIAAGAPGDRGQWLKQLADTVGYAVQSGSYPGGVERLKTVFEKLSKEEDQELAAYVKFRYLSAENTAALQTENPDFSGIQAKWLENLEKFVTDYPNSPDTAEAILQLGIAQEFAGQEDKAKTWYSQLVSRFKNSPSAAKAAGALTRLESVGKPVSLKGKTLRNEAVELAKYKGRVVLIHYWATWCEPCKTDLAQLKELKAKYGKGGFELIGVSLDNTDKLLADHLAKNPLPWPQLYEPGGLDSRLANEMGILTLPTMILVDAQGNVSNRSVHITELDGELKALIK